MIKKLTTYSSLLFALILIRFSSDAQKAVVLHIAPQNSLGANVSQVFDSIHFIPLETNKKSLFGDIDQLSVTEKYFIILDNHTTFSILIFDKKGKFHAKIMGERASFQNPFDQIRYFDVTKDGLICFEKGKGGLLYYYNFDGKLIRKTTGRKYYSWSHFLFSDTSYAYYNRSIERRYKDSILHELSIVDNGLIEKAYFPFNQKTGHLQTQDNLGVGKSFSRIGNTNMALFVRSYDYTIYQVSPQGLESRFSFIFPAENTLPKDFAQNSVYDGKRLKYFNEHTDVIYGLSNTYLMGDNLFFRLCRYNFSIPNSFIYNFKSSNLYAIKYIIPDSSSYFLPFTDIGLGLDFANKNFLTSHDGFLYTSYAARAFVKVVEKLNPKHGAMLPKVFRSVTIQNNPVIVAIKPKTNL